MADPTGFANPKKYEPGEWASSSTEVLNSGAAAALPPLAESALGWREVDAGVPVITNEDPVPFETGVDEDKVISFDLTDPEGRLDNSSVLIWVDGALAYYGVTDAFQSPFTGVGSVRTPIANGSTYAIDKLVAYPAGGTVTIRVYAKDTRENVIDQTWTFDVQIVSIIDNPSYEIAGTAPGEAKYWTQVHDDAAEQIAPFEGSVLPMDDFEKAWGGGNQLSIQEFEDDDLNPAGFNSARDEDDNYVNFVEDMQWEWRSPRRHTECELSNAGRGTPIYPDPKDALSVGLQYRDLATGGLAYLYWKDTGGNEVRFYFVDWLNPIGSRLGFCHNATAGGSSIGHTVAERHVGSALIGTGDGVDKQFVHTSVLLPIHAKLADWGAFFHIDVTIDGELHHVYDDGAGNLTSSSSILETSLPNSIDYITGDISLTLNTAPDADVGIFAYFEYGATVLTETADNASNLPHVITAREMNESLGDELPPYNHSAVDAFLPANLIQAEFDGIEQAEDFEQKWRAPVVGSAPYNEESIDEFTPTDLTQGTFTGVNTTTEDFESDWGWGPGNQASQNSFDPADLVLGITEDFESGWTTIPI